MTELMLEMLGIMCSQNLPLVSLISSPLTSVLALTPRFSLHLWLPLICVILSSEILSPHSLNHTLMLV